MAHKFSDINLYLQAFYAFLSFSFTASFVYVLNDLMDLESDRKHPRKKNRPIASGKLSVRRGLAMLPLLLSVGIIFGVMVSANFLLVLAFYLFLTSSYSFKLKKYYIIDIIILSALYSIRLIAGAVAVEVDISHWLLAFSMFIFLSLAFVKRFTEVRVMIDQNKTKTSGRGYLISDEHLLSSLGVGSALMSVLVFLLYANSPEIMELYKRPELFYGIAPFLLYWLIRIWFKAHRDEMHDDPIVFTGKDWASYVIGLLIAVLVIGAMI
jgi:4-hydroxybenzoate polyprenyltransferase